MCKDTNYLLFSMLRSLFCNKELADREKALVTEETIEQVIRLASKHDIAHLIALSILNNGLSNDKNKSKLQEYALRAFHRYAIQNNEFIQICEVLEKEQIPFIPLKGSVLRNHYPEPWWRTSCDIDVLVEEHNLQKAISCLIENLEYTEQKHNSHDVTLSSKSGICLELHFYLGEEGRANFAVDTLKDVWNYSQPKDGCKFCLEMSDDMFYYYHIAHMAEHFETGGCGIRPFVDLWILDNMESVDVGKRNRLLKAGNLLKFANKVRKLSRIWFGGDSHDDVTLKLENYIISGGVYGSIENNVKVQQIKQGSKFRFIMSKIFLPTRYIEQTYPSVKKRKWLIPFMQIRRWITIAVRGISPRTKNELKSNREISSTQAEQMRNFLDEVGL